MREQVPGALLVCPVPNQLEAMPCTDAILKSVGENQRPSLTQVDFHDFLQAGQYSAYNHTSIPRPRRKLMYPRSFS